MKLRPDIVAVYREIHSWVGVITGLFLFIAFHDVIFTVQNEFLAQNSSQLHREDRHGGDHATGELSGRVHSARQRVLLAPDYIVSQLAHEAPGFTPDMLDYVIRPDASSGAVPILRVMGHDPAHVMRGPTSGFVTLDPYTGKILWRAYLPGHQSAGFATLTSFFALHFGSYGGAPIRWAYLVLGFAGAFLFYTGNRLWIAVRRRKEKATGCLTDTRGTRFLSRLTTGCCTGCMTAIAVLLCVALIAPSVVGEREAFMLYHGVFWAMMLMALPMAWGETLVLWLATLAHAALAVIVLGKGGPTSAMNWGVALIALGLAGILYRLFRQSRAVHSV